MLLYPGMTTGHVEVDGGTVQYHQAGECRNGEYPVVLLHGTGGTTDTHFATLFPMLADAHRVISVDLAPLQPTSAPHLRDLRRRVTGAIAAIDGLRDFHLLGYSLGGAVAIEVAAELGDRITSLTLLNSWARTDPTLRLWLQTWHALNEAKDYSVLASYMLTSTHSRRYINARPSTELDSYLSSYRPGPEAAEQMTIDADIDVTQLAGELTTPTLIIGSLRDTLIPIGHSHELFGLIGNSRLAEIDCGHASLVERPAEVLALITDFMSSPSATQPGEVIRDTYLPQLSDLAASIQGARS